MDTIITGGLLVDGTGAAPFEADIALKDGKIAAIGKNLGTAARMIDAKGCIVTPGFVDIHTHYDGQVSWDEEFRPSSVHGVTTAVMGSCGVGFAPVKKADRERIIGLMEGVEDIPGAALAEGLNWRWETVEEYMNALDAMPHAIDFAVVVPHDALRVYVMGERAEAREPATDEDLAQMQAVLRGALQAGAVGFSTGRSDNHKDNRGADTPAAEASKRELEALAAALKGTGRRTVQIVSDFDLGRGPGAFDAEFDLVDAMATASGAPLSISLLQRIGDIDQWKRILQRVEASVARGLEMKVQSAPRGIGVLIGLEATFHPFIGFPSYKEVATKSLAERVAHLRNPEVRARILSETSERLAGDGSSVPPLVDQLLANIDFVSMSLFRLGERPNYEPKREDSIFGEAMRSGRKVLEVLYDAMLEQEGHALLYFPIYNYASGNLDVVAEMLHHPRTLFGLSDGGAHVGTICDGSFPSFLLSHWARDRAERKLPLEKAVHMLTGANAAWAGFGDRGELAVGKKADVNVIDLAGLELLPPRLVHDLPAGGKRFLQDARGYRATIVSGEVVAQNGELTGARPGRLVRGSN
jgi:N-acyl-D-aspartate/D-glutamate deacylase